MNSTVYRVYTIAFIVRTSVLYRGRRSETAEQLAGAGRGGHAASAETEEQEGGGTGRARRTTVAMGGVLGRLFKVKKLELVLVGIENS